MELYSGGGGGNWGKIPSIPTHGNTSTSSNQDHLYLSPQQPQQFQLHNKIISTNHSLLTSTSYITCGGEFSGSDSAWN
uniref:Uncharacterized protein n=1 Tax=Quercus lobata TaxID=97700 RepID=A0A7N2LMI5_QUELO